VNTGGGGNYECSNCPPGFIGEDVKLIPLAHIYMTIHFPGTSIKEAELS
jgi:hypothetical protein